MNLLKKISPEWSLRLGTSVMYLYSGQDIFRYPTAWTWALPYWFTQAVSSIMPIETYLKIQGIGEIVMALALLAWFLKPQILKYFALLSVLEMAGILLLSPPSQFGITFRDIGLLGGSIALFLMLANKTYESAKPVMVQ